MPRKANPLRPGHLRVARERLGLSQSEVAYRAKMRSGQSGVSAVEHGKSPGREADVLKVLLAAIDETRAERFMERHRLWQLAEDQARIARQEAVWNALPESPEKSALLDAMIDRCFDLMCIGHGGECDAIAEWLPPDRVRAMFDAWERWDQGESTGQPAASATPEATATRT